MSNQVQFLKGSQRGLESLKSSQIGAFYLTDDTHRLYVGAGDNLPPQLLNKAVIVIDTIDQLPSNAYKDDLYYIKNGNMLIIYTGEGSQPWTQLNVDTNTDTNHVIETTSLTVEEPVKTDDTLTYKIVLKQQEINKFADTGDEPTQLKDLEASLVIKSDVLAGLVPEASSVDLASSIDTTNDTVTITTSGTGAAQNGKGVTIKSGGNISIGKDENNNILIDSIPVTTAGASLSGTLLTITDTVEGSVTADLAGLVDAANDYTDGLFATMNQALKYKGTVASKEILLAKTPSTGDVYKASATDTTKSDQIDTFEVGDIFIYNENKWERIPSGDETDTRYAGVATVESSSIKFGIKEDITGNDDIAGDELTLTFGTGLTFDSDNNTLSTTSLTTAEDEEVSLDHSGTFTVKEPVVDTNGYLTGLSSTVYTLPEDQNTTYALSLKTTFDAEQQKNVPTNTVELIASDSDTGDTHDAITLTTATDSNISISASVKDKNVTYTFGMVWGEF